MSDLFLYEENENDGSPLIIEGGSRLNIVRNNIFKGSPVFNRPKDCDLVRRFFEELKIEYNQDNIKAFQEILRSKADEKSSFLNAIGERFGVSVLGRFADRAVDEIFKHLDALI